MNTDLLQLCDIRIKLHLAEIVKNINLTIKHGEICSVIGENAAGKSTLMKVLSGVIPNYSGQIYFEGKQIRIQSHNDARNLGIHMLFHEPLLFDQFSVEYNMFAGNEIHYGSTFFIRKAHQHKEAQKILDYLECDFSTEALVEDLSHAQKRLVEIAKALVSNAKLLIFDEVTSQYTQQEINFLLHILKKLKNRLSIVYISHNIEDVINVSDKIVVMRDGEIIDVSNNKDGIDIDNLIDKMAGNDLVNRYPRTKATKGGCVLEIDNISNSAKTIKNASLFVRRGEIVGIAGFHDSGKVDLIKMIRGVDPIDSGSIKVDNELVKLKSPYQAIKNGIMYLSEDISKNIHLQMDVSYNITLANLRKAEKMFLVKLRSIISATKYYIKRMNIKINSISLPSRYHSRGTQQKIALSKVLYADAQILVMNEPTTSLDSSSKVEFYNIINQLAHKGKGILFSSSDLRELIGMCDRIYIVRDGCIAGELASKEASSSKILHYVTGKSNE